MRRALALVVAGAAVTLTAGCSVSSGAVAGIGVDAKGNPVGYLQVCHDHIDGATIYIDDTHTFGDWQTSPGATGFAMWSMVGMNETWKAKKPLGNLKAGTTYWMYGWTKDNSSSAVAVSFAPADLAGMKPGQVRYWAGKTTSDGRDEAYSVTSEDEFRRTACQVVGS